MQFKFVVNGCIDDWIIQLTLLLVAQTMIKKESEEGEREIHGRVISIETESIHTHKEYIYINHRRF